MPGPANISFVTAVDLGALPASYTQTDINDAGVNYDTFYKFTAPVGCVLAWAWITSENIGSGYQPNCVPYDVSQVEILSDSATAPLLNNPIQFPVTAGQIHYLKAVKNTDTVGPEHVNIEVRAAPTTSTIPLDAILVNGDHATQPCGVFSPTTDYTTIKFVGSFAFGEGGCIAINGKSLFENRNLADKFVALYDTSLTELGRATTLAFSEIRNNRTTGYFWVYVREDAAYAKLYKVNPAVIPLVLTSVATITGGGAGGAISTNPAETIAYYRDTNAFNRPIKRWDLSLNIAMSDLVAAYASRFTTDTLCLENGYVVAGWSDASAAGFVQAKVYDSTGAVISSSSDFESYEAGGYGFARLAYASDSPTSFWLKTRERSGAIPTGDALFKRITTATGVVTATVRHLEYNMRNYIGPAAASYRGITGIWNSCPFVAWQIGAASPPGMYKIVTDKRNDNDLAIPTPTFKTGLMP